MRGDAALFHVEHVVLRAVIRQTLETSDSSQQHLNRALGHPLQNRLLMLRIQLAGQIIQQQNRPVTPLLV